MLSIASMEVTSDPGIMASREPFSVGPQKSPQKSPIASPPAMKLSYTTDGTAVYTPIPTSSPPPFQSIGGGGPGGNIDAGGGNGLLAPVSQQGMGINMGEPMKKKRGRPRKYGPAGSMALAVVPMKRSSTASAEAMKKARGRPPGSGKKRQMAALGSTGIGFIPHIIMVKAGEDVFSKIISFSQHGPRAVCVLSANGAISNVTLRQAATSGGTVTYEGRFEILSLSGSSLPSESDGQRSRTGGLSVSLAGSDGRVLGGGVAGPLTAASPVQVIVGSFLADGKKESKPKSPSDPISAPAKLVPSGPIRPSSPPSRGTQSESSGGPGSPLNQNTGTFNNNNQQGTSNMPWI